MGLAERRATKEFQDTLFPALKAAMDAAAGFPVTLSVNWEQLAKDDASHGYAEAWPKIYFQTATDAFKSIARDAMGKDALKAGLKSVVFQNTGGFRHRLRRFHSSMAFLPSITTRGATSTTFKIASILPSRY